jgi:hypothetical protein
MAKIEFNPWDLEISTIKSGDYVGTKKVQIKWMLATDETFVQEMMLLGIKEYIKKDKDGEDSKE